MSPPLHPRWACTQNFKSLTRFNLDNPPSEIALPPKLRECMFLCKFAIHDGVISLYCEWNPLRTNYVQIEAQIRGRILSEPPTACTLELKSEERIYLRYQGSLTLKHPLPELLMNRAYLKLGITFSADAEIKSSLVNDM